MADLVQSIDAVFINRLFNSNIKVIHHLRTMNAKSSNKLKARCGEVVSVVDSGASGRGLSPGRGYCVVFLGKTLNSHSASLRPGV